VLGDPALCEQAGRGFPPIATGMFDTLGNRGYMNASRAANGDRCTLKRVAVRGEAIHDSESGARVHRPGEWFGLFVVQPGPRHHARLD
jgi:hypothetical protein